MTAPTWNLETIFPGGLTGKAFGDALSASEGEVRALLTRGDALPALPDGLDEAFVVQRWHLCRE